jgi:hypothetical protein
MPTFSIKIEITKAEMIERRPPIVTGAITISLVQP